MRDSSEMNGNVADEALLREDMVGGGGGGRYSGGMKPPMDEKSNGYYVDLLYSLEMRKRSMSTRRAERIGGE